ncbi:hypothetical protein HELRODRAFT_165536 [Helobdella robusta]|uniref:Uncharacterized protein n=1 Tax=Helobdella robusta TaxID=6412 RepID=T1EWZ4_HELRO|nr:hypothetical protein HELRODRAFT_165536 [Helobdella robusta]ESN91494.1 hypothetical protein HELRODRAFT_165536 [Helobdella robusta]
MVVGCNCAVAVVEDEKVDDARTAVHAIIVSIELQRRMHHVDPRIIRSSWLPIQNTSGPDFASLHASQFHTIGAVKMPSKTIDSIRNLRLSSVGAMSLKALRRLKNDDEHSLICECGNPTQMYFAPYQHSIF